MGKLGKLPGLTRAICVSYGLSRRHHKKWHKALKLAQVGMPIHKLAVQVHTARTAMDATASGKARVEVASQEELDHLPFWMQGDAAFQNDAVIQLRAQLRHHPNIVAQLQLWWETAQRSMRQTHGADYAADCVSREEYIRVSRLLSRTMLEDFDSGEAQRVRALPSASC